MGVPSLGRKPAGLKKLIASNTAKETAQVAALGNPQSSRETQLEH